MRSTFLSALTRTVLLTIIVAGPAAPAAAQGVTQDWKLHDPGQVRQLVTNRGILNKLGTSYPGLINSEYPSRSFQEHMGGVGWYIGAVVDGPSGPDTLASVTKSWGSSDEMLGFSSEPWDTIWVAQRGDTLDIPYLDEPYVTISDQDFVTRYNDYNEASLQLPNHTPLGIDVVQKSHAWALPPLDEVIVLDYAVVSTRNSLREVYLANFVDGNVGYRTGSGFAFGNDDFATYHPEFNMGISHDAPGGADGGEYTPMGMMFFPPDDVLEEELTWTFVHGETAPGQDPDRYRHMSSGRVMDDQAMPGQAVYILSAGPFDLPKGDTLRFRFAIVMGEDEDAVLANADAVVSLADGRRDGQPVAVADSVVTDEEVPLEIGLLDNDYDPDGATVRFATWRQPAHGSVDLSGQGTMHYRPDDNFSGIDRFYYAMTDDADGYGWGEVTVEVRPVPDAPVFTSTPPLEVGHGKTYAYVIGTADGDGDDVRVEAESLPRWLTLETSEAGSVVLRGNPGYEDVGEHEIVLHARDGTLSARQAFTIQVVNTPVAVADTVVTRADAPVVVDVLENDHDPNDDPIRLVAVGDPRRGTAVLDSAMVRYTPPPDFYDTDSFTYTIADSRGDSSEGTAYVHVLPTEGRPPAGSILIVDETRSGFDYKPLCSKEADEFQCAGATDRNVSAFYEDIFSVSPEQVWDYWAEGGPPPREVLEQYRVLIWHADHLYHVSRDYHRLADHEELLAEYLDGGGNLIVSGWRILTPFRPQGDWYHPQVFKPGSFMHDYLGVSEVVQTPKAVFSPGDFSGARGADVGLSDVAVDTAKTPWPYDGGLGSIHVVRETAGSATALYTYRSRGLLDEGAAFEEGAVGINHTDIGRRSQVVVLGFPLFFLEREDARTLAGEVLASMSRTRSAIDAAPRRMRLTLNTPYPNPSYGAVRLGYHLPRTIRTRLTLYDVLGRKSAVVRDRVQTQGEHTFLWQLPASLSAGVYILRLEAGGEAVVQRLVLLR